jgi:YggT family protein
VPKIQRRGNIMPSLFGLLVELINVYIWLIIIWVILGWLQAYNVLPYNRFLHSIMAVIFKLTDPPLSFVRRFMPPIGGFDLSPIVVIIALQLLKALLFDLLI